MVLIDKCEKIIQSESSAQLLRPTVASQIMWSFTKLEYVPSDETLKKIEAAWLNSSSNGVNFRDFQEGSSLLIWAHATFGKLPSADLLFKVTTPPTKKAASFWTPVSMWMTFWSLSLLNLRCMHNRGKSYRRECLEQLLRKGNLTQRWYSR